MSRLFRDVVPVRDCPSILLLCGWKLDMDRTFQAPVQRTRVDLRPARVPKHLASVQLHHRCTSVRSRRGPHRSSLYSLDRLDPVLVRFHAAVAAVQGQETLPVSYSVPLHSNRIRKALSERQLGSIHCVGNRMDFRFVPCTGSASGPTRILCTGEKNSPKAVSYSPKYSIDLDETFVSALYRDARFVTADLLRRWEIS